MSSLLGFTSKHFFYIKKANHCLVNVMSLWIREFTTVFYYWTLQGRLLSSMAAFRED